MGIFDVVNEKDEVIGQATRDECHNEPGLIHRTAQFTLIDKKTRKILITQRSFSQETDQGKICFLGKHVTTGESYQNTIVRGVEEELGFKPKSIKEMATNLFKFPEQTEISKFFVVSWEGEKINFSEDELVNIKWLSLEEIRSSKIDYSNTTQYWVEAIDWGLVFTQS